MLTVNPDYKEQIGNSLMNYLIENFGFKELLLSDRSFFSAYQKKMLFADLCFSQLWAWAEHFHYIYKIFGELIAVYGMTDTGEFGCTFITAEYRREDIRAAVDLIGTAFEKHGAEFKISYVPKEAICSYTSLEEYRTYVEYDRAMSDYIYLTSDFVCLDGKKNKAKRNELRALGEFGGKVECRDYTPKMYKDLCDIFDCWCKSHSCDSCYYGCEKKAFDRLIGLYDESFICSVVYIDDAPVSFGLAEKTNEFCTVFHFQKNAVRIPGLTYYLHYEMAKKHKDTKFVNWGEDMGIDGIRLNKLKYHPYEIKPKYSIKFTGKEV